MFCMPLRVWPFITIIQWVCSLWFFFFLSRWSPFSIDCCRVFQQESATRHQVYICLVCLKNHFSNSFVNWGNTIGSQRHQSLNNMCNCSQLYHTPHNGLICKIISKSVRLDKPLFWHQICIIAHTLLLKEMWGLMISLATVFQHNDLS